jgi:outer membrane protein OmpA-like peptidoglycan-associated protein
MRRILLLALSFLWIAPLAAKAEPTHHAPGLFLAFFQPWSSDLDASNRKIVEAAAAQAKKTAQSHVTVLGYADTEGSAKANLDLAKQRVETVRLALVHAGYPNDEITVKPVGSVPPMGDAQESRRVEITIRTP